MFVPTGTDMLCLLGVMLTVQLQADTAGGGQLLEICRLKRVSRRFDLPVRGLHLWHKTRNAELQSSLCCCQRWRKRQYGK
jgi:hypothetical protein